MANTRDLNQKIASLGNMQKVMRAMNMIATVKLRKLFPTQEALELFGRGVEGLKADLLANLAETEHPLVQGHPACRRAHVVIVTADKGLCGSHNNAVQKALDLLKATRDLDNVSLELSCVGNKGANYVRRKDYALFHAAEINDRVFGPAELRDLSARIFQRYLAGEIQEIHVIFNEFVSTIQQDTRSLCLLPLARATVRPADPRRAGKVGGPGGRPAVAVGALAPEADDFAVQACGNYLHFALKTALANSALSEQASRMTAMENASNNSRELIDRYVLLRNRSRQSAITNELIEIISGKEALKG